MRILQGLWALGLVTFMASTSAQVPTPDQLEMLKSLSPSDRAELMQSLGISTEDTGATPDPKDDAHA